jgi:pyruvate-formate lyase-activating enzyme/flavodoxin
VRDAIANGCLSIASTYNEPTVSSEFSHATFKLAKEKGLYTAYVTNGYESEECLNYLGPYLDAVNIDLKSFSDEFYMKVCGAHLKPVCDTIKRCYAMGIHTEVTTLVIPGNNDSDEELTKTAEFIASVGKDIPWHLSAYHDAYKFSGLGHTPLKTLQRAYSIGKKAGLQFVYLGNVSAPEARVTKCPACENTLIDRAWFDAKVKIHGGKCKCGQVIPGLFVDADNRKPKLNSVPEILLSRPVERKVGLPKDVVLYATQGGTSKEVAEKVAAAIGYAVHDINGVTVGEIASCNHVIFAVATYGRGAPPAAATSFWGSLQNSNDQLPQLKYTVIGLGSSGFAKTFCGFGKDLDAALQKLGATQMMELCTIDDQEDNPEIVEKWIEGFKSLK